MVFSSITFLFYFLPAFLLVYFLSPNAIKNTILFLFSLIFYAWGEPYYVFLMIFSTVLDYCCGRAAEHFRGKWQGKAALLLSLSGNLGLLCTFKYSGFFAEIIRSVFHADIPVPDLALPIGISFYTFQTMSYTIDVYCGKIKAQKNLISFGAYVTLFPQLIAGPIVRYETVAEELNHRTHSMEGFAEGIRRFICGLAKKVLLANPIGLLWETASRQSHPSLLLSWLGILAFGFQIYFDFSGYSDMAIGLGRMLGFHFPENFAYPFCSKSITEFWRRWHISLGTWFRDYVYIPLGGSRKGKVRQLFYIFLVWFLTGLWHGAAANYILWGIYFGILLVMEKLYLLKKLERLPSVFGHIYSLFFITLSWVLFAFEDLSQGRTWLKSIVGCSGLADKNSLYLFFSYLPLLLLCALASLPIGKKLYKKAENRIGNCLMTITDCVGTAGMLLLAIAYLISGSYNPFLYFRF